MTRRTVLFLPAFGAFPLLAQGQYSPQAAPAKTFSPSPEQAAEIRRKMGKLPQSLSALRQKNVPDESLVEVEIFHKAAQWIGHHNEYFHENSAAQTLSLLDIGIARAGELEAGKPSWPSATGLVVRAYRSRLDGSAQPYLAHVPASYNGRQPVRMDVLLHGTNRSMVEVNFMSRAPGQSSHGGILVTQTDFIQIEVLGRTNNVFRWAGEADVLEAVEAARRGYAIDENRIVLRGF